MIDIAELKEEFKRDIGLVDSIKRLNEVKHKWTSKTGILKNLSKKITSIPLEKRAEFGKLLNSLRDFVRGEIQEKEKVLKETQEREKIDFSLPGRKIVQGAIHPVTVVIYEIIEIFNSLGYSVAEGPEIEDDFHNFEALNIPPYHPARDAQDTFFVKGDRLLRTHTSPVQIRTMLARKPPIRIICPGKVYRRDNDLRHSPMFHQVEGLVVDKGIAFTHLKGTLLYFLRELFGKGINLRFRPSYFPFTEPSAEVDISCPFCEGSNVCKVCGGANWIEILGAGMVDPRVLRNCAINPDNYSGFAFGLGVDRIAMIKYSIPNIRILFDNDIDVLSQIN